MAVTPTLLASGHTASGGAGTPTQVSGSFTPTADGTIYAFGVLNNGEQAYPASNLNNPGASDSAGRTWTPVVSTATVQWGADQYHLRGVLWSAPAGGGTPAPTAVTVDPNTTNSNLFFTDVIVFEIAEPHTVVKTATGVVNGNTGDSVSVTATFAPPQFVGSTTNPGGGPTDVTLDIPDGTTVTDTVFLFAKIEGTHTDPAGWEVLGRATEGAARVSVYSRTGLTDTDTVTVDAGDWLGGATVVTMSGVEDVTYAADGPIEASIGTSFPWGGVPAESSTAVLAAPFAHYRTIETADVMTPVSTSGLGVFRSSAVGPVTFGSSVDIQWTLFSVPHLILRRRATLGNLVMGLVGAANDNPTAMTAPSGYTSLHNAGTIRTKSAAFHRSDYAGDTFTVSDLGQEVGNGVAITVEFAPAGGPTNHAATPNQVVATTTTTAAVTARHAATPPSIAATTATSAVATVTHHAEPEPVNAVTGTSAELEGGALAVTPTPTVVLSGSSAAATVNAHAVPLPVAATTGTGATATAQHHVTPLPVHAVTGASATTYDPNAAGPVLVGRRTTRILDAHRTTEFVDATRRTRILDPHRTTRIEPT